MNEPARNHFETCPSCWGSGLQPNDFNGEPEICRECKGDTVVLAHDERGRFIPYPKDEANS